MTAAPAWMLPWTIGRGMMQTGVRFVETMTAAGQVIGGRTQSIGLADYREVPKMVPEKVAAFGRAGASIADDLGAIQAEMLAQGQHAAALMTSGRFITPADMAALTSRAGRIAERAAGAAGKALVPIHTAATGNARRLSRARQAKR